MLHGSTFFWNRKRTNVILLVEKTGGGGEGKWERCRERERANKTLTNVNNVPKVKVCPL